MEARAAKSEGWAEASVSGWRLHDLLPNPTHLQQALQQGDLDEAVVVLLSIVSSSRMVGAVPLSQTARRIQQAAHDDDRGPCVSVLPRQLGDAACCDLSSRFDLP